MSQPFRFTVGMLIIVGYVSFFTEVVRTFPAKFLTEDGSIISQNFE
jgi:hypothetical protein